MKRILCAIQFFKGACVGTNNRDAWPVHDQCAVAKMLRSSEHIGNALLQVAAQNGLRLTPLQLIKLVYIAHGWSLVLLKKPLVDEYAQAWTYGPVFPKLYHQLKKYRAEPVEIPRSYTGPALAGLNEEEKNLLSQVIQVYGRLTGTQLSSLTHKSGTPWSVVWKEKGQNSNIPNTLIKEHYEMLAKRSKHDGDTATS